jgi:hypothetical protein
MSILYQCTPPLDSGEITVPPEGGFCPTAIRTVSVWIDDPGIDVCLLVLLGVLVIVAGLLVWYQWKCKR